jgi:TonB-dependent starch-binding outer membrane protein SusC
MNLRFLDETLRRYEEAISKLSQTFTCHLHIYSKILAMRLLCKRLLLRSTCILCFSFILVFHSNAQNRKRITGAVTNSKGEPVVAASVVVKGTTSGTTTDQKGTFSIDAPENATLVISSVGFQTQEIAVKGDRSFTVHLQDNAASSMNEVVVVGYGTVRKKDLTGSVAVVNVEEAKKTASYDIAKLLQGQVAGVSVHGSGEPGGFVQIKIRGISNFGDNSPLFVIDGVPTEAPFDFSPDDIESIQVLKDASAGAIYGSRAATGVVIITTKKGKAGVPRVTVNSYYGVQNVPKKISVLNREQYQKVVNAADLNAGNTLAPANDPSNPNYVSKINTDWQNEALKTGSIEDHNIGLSGGSDLLSYNISLGYFKQSGYQVGPQAYNRYTLNTNLQGKKGKLSYGTKVAYTYSKKGNYAATNGHAVFGGTVTNILTAIPTMPVYDSARLGGYGGTDQTINRAISANVVGINKLVQDWSERNRILLNGWAELEIVKNLKYKINASFDRTDYKNYHFEPRFDMGYYYINNEYFYSENLGQPNTRLIENTLSYSFNKVDHHVDLLAGYTFEKGHNDFITGTSRAGTNLLYQTFSNAAASANTISEGRGTYVTTGLIGRLNYNFASRYLFTANFRRDGSSKFSPSKQYGNFAGFAAAWNLRNEKFITLPGEISTLKIRAGWGTLGNQKNLGYYDWQSYINSAANYDLNNVLAPGATTVSAVDPDLHWETTTTKDLGIDLGMFNERLTLTAEYYEKLSKDIIVRIPVPYSVGSIPSTLLTNAASVKNSGVELTLGYKNSGKLFSYGVNANFSTLTNKVVKLGGTNNPIYGAGSKTEVGRSVGELYGYQTEGLFQSVAEIQNHAFQSGATSPGDVKFKAQDAKNETNHGYTLTDAKDRTYLGNTIPKYYYGLNFNAGYKNLDFTMFWQGSAGNKVFNGVYQALMTGQYGNQHTDELNFWTSSNTQTNVPRPIIGDPNGNGRFSDRFVENGSYIKLQDVQVGYNIPLTIANKRFFSKLRVYVSGQNVLIISKYKGYDPDFISDGLFNRGFDYGSFPNARTFLFGVQAGF